MVYHPQLDNRTMKSHFTKRWGSNMCRNSEEVVLLNLRSLTGGDMSRALLLGACLLTFRPSFASVGSEAAKTAA